MKTTKLIIEYDYHFLLLAIIAPVKEFKLAWYLNQSLEIDLLKNSDLEYHFVKRGRFLVSNFLFESEYTTFRLLKNKAYEAINVAKPFLAPELKEYDFFLQITGELSTINSEEIIKKIKQLAVINYAENVVLENLKSKDNFIID